jgi:hypothetical protein
MTDLSKIMNQQKEEWYEFNFDENITLVKENGVKVICEGIAF